jgi:hypothetical protein
MNTSNNTVEVDKTQKGCSFIENLDEYL